MVDEPWLCKWILFNGAMVFLVSALDALVGVWNLALSTDGVKV